MAKAQYKVGVVEPQFPEGKISKAKHHLGLRKPCQVLFRGNRYTIKVKALISPCLLTDCTAKPIVALWGELTPRGNMVHQEVEREDGVQDQLVLGSLNSSQDLRRT